MACPELPTVHDILCTAKTANTLLPSSAPVQLLILVSWQILTLLLCVAQQVCHLLSPFAHLTAGSEARSSGDDAKHPDTFGACSL